MFFWGKIFCKMCNETILCIWMLVIKSISLTDTLEKYIYRISKQSFASSKRKYVLVWNFYIAVSDFLGK